MQILQKTACIFSLLHKNKSEKSYTLNSVNFGFTIDFFRYFVL